MSSQATSNDFKRTMQSRHLVMLSLGGVIGTGLFLSSGYTVNQAGPLGAIIAYLIGGLVVYLVMMCLGELAVEMPETGSFNTYATRTIGPGTGYTVAWLYWLTWTVALGSEFTAAGLLMQHWFSDVPVWAWSALFAAIIFLLNAFSSRVFAETEFWLSLIKVLTVLAFIVIGAAGIFGLTPAAQGHGAPLLSNLTADGWFPTGVMPILMTMLAVSFAFSGTELIGIAAGETVEPEKNVPRAIKATLWRLVIFFVGTIIVIAALLPWQEASVLESPFVAVFSKTGIPYAADIMNFVIITALLSAANSGLYAASRMLWSLAEQKTLPQMFGRVTRGGVPLNAIIFSMIGGLFSLLSSRFAPDTVYIALVSISGFAVVAVWMVIAASQFMFRRQYLAAGHDPARLGYRAPLYPLVPLLAFGFCALSLIGIAFDPSQRVALYFGLPFVALCYLMYYLTRPEVPGNAQPEERPHD
ncbi:amino acid permease [Larsenimonas salina]|uniref:amino acid permease n=1 Tax=Larsenimonas salina TaxID=1295565 RepID=UPI0020740289|nr:amino acid permease [Larsenimonas salina]MCM5705152.1 amino acid permease [Larsenimonas salina]